jgi:hypothetical protein
MQVVLNTLYVSLWISLSGTVILYNKWILAYFGFPYPITLTMWHMFFSSALAFLCVRSGFVASVNMTMDTYVRAVLPIGALFAGKLLGDFNCYITPSWHLCSETWTVRPSSFRFFAEPSPSKPQLLATQAYQDCWPFFIIK